MSRDIEKASQLEALKAIQTRARKARVVRPEPGKAFDVKLLFADIEDDESEESTHTTEE